MLLRDSAEDAELRVQVRTDVHDGGYVATTVAVIWGGPNSNNGLLGEVVLRSLAKTCA